MPAITLRFYANASNKTRDVKLSVQGRHISLWHECFLVICPSCLPSGSMYYINPAVLLFPPTLMRKEKDI